MYRISSEGKTGQYSSEPWQLRKSRPELERRMQRCPPAPCNSPNVLPNWGKHSKNTPLFGRWPRRKSAAVLIRQQRCNGDDSFGPSLGPGSDCHNFDFTILFEDCVSSLIPSAVAILAAACRIYVVRNRSKVINWPDGRALKLAGFLVLAILQSALIGLWSCGHGTRTQLTVPASIIALVATLSLAVLSDFEHNRVVRPSLVAQSYLFFTALLDLARVRSQWLVDDNNIVASIVTATFILKLAILAVESIEKHPYTSTKGDGVPPLERCGIFGRALLLWLNPLFMLGYRQDLAMDNLFPLDHDLRGSHLENRLERRWRRTNKSRKHCLTAAVLVNFIPEIVISWFPRALNIAFLIAQPVVSYGYGLIGAFGIVYIGAAISNQMFSFLCFRLMVKMRGSLVGMIYRDMLTIRAESKNSSSAMTLMSTDVDRIRMTARWVVDMIPNIVQLGIAMWILSLELGAVCVAPVIVALLCGGGAAGIANLVPRRQRKWIAAIQKRVGITSDILGVMKGVKMLGISEPLSKQIQGLRDFEIAESKRFRKVQDFLLIEKRIDYRTRIPSCTGSHEEKSSSRLGGKPADALIIVKEGTFGWDKAQDKPILKDINLESGSVHVAGMGDVAYCDQEAWILNQSIRDNIVAFSDYSEDFYNAVIRACQLEEDLSHLPKGDLSNVGSHGISLSGGQKQRLALARAVYSRQNIVIMNDSMKGLDADTSSKCFRALLGKNGLLRKSGITVIMATHNAQWFPFADQLIVLNGEGHIESCGSFEDLKDSDAYIKSLESSYN
ncbi:ABC transporter [Seiridium cupressi]